MGKNAVSSGLENELEMKTRKTGIYTFRGIYSGIYISRILSVKGREREGESWGGGVPWSLDIYNFVSILI